MTSHHCPDNPAAVNDWAEGTAASCEFHKRLPTNSGGWRWGKGIRSKMDREVGTVGTQRDGYISGTDSGR